MRTVLPRKGMGTGPGALFLYLLAVACPGLRSDLAAGEPEPSFERLVQLNSRDILGTEVELKEGRMILRFPGKGTFGAAFRAPGGGGRGFISDVAGIKDTLMRKMLTEGVEAGFSAAGLDTGDALSKFELGEDFKISFKLKPPRVPDGATFLLRVNQEDGKNFLQTSFFQDITVMENGRPRRKTASDKRFQAPASRWFLQKHSPTVPVEVVFKEKKLSIFVTIYPEKDKPERVETVSQDGIEKPLRGKMSIKFSKLSFAMVDLVIDSKVPRTWLEGEIARLRKDGKLKLKEAEVASKPGEKAPQARKPAKPAKGGVNVEDPDPEAEDDL